MHMLKDGGFIPKDDDNTLKRDKVLKIAWEQGWLDDNFGVHFYEAPEDQNNVQFYQQMEEDDSLDEELLSLAKKVVSLFNSLGGKDSGKEKSQKSKNY